MLNTKLIFVEGLPGLGKSTAAAWLAKRYASQGKAVHLYMETQPKHPLNVGGDLHPAGNTTGESLFQKYTPESYIHESLERWRAFVSTSSQAESICVLDSFPYQNTVRVLMQLDASRDDIQRYTREVEEMTAPLLPVLVYFNHRDTTSMIEHFNRICEQRGQEWEDYVIELIEHCPYAEARHLTGKDGLITFITDYKQLIDALMSQSHLPRIVLEDFSKGYDECYRQIETFLGLATQASA